MRLFLAGTSLHPSYGGPAVSVRGMAEALAAAGVDVGLWAPDQSVSLLDAPASAGIRPLLGSPQDALAAFGRPDIIHDNGIWLPHNHGLAALARRLGAPRLVSTRGMLEPWAFRHKRLKKALAWCVYQRRDLQRARLLHATAGQEADNLRAMRLGPPVQVIPNGVALPAPQARSAPASSALRTALFIGRLYPVKGLPMLIEAWAQVRPPGWRLVIAGPDEAGHRAELEAAVAAAGLQQTISLPGPLDGPAKAAALSSADLLVLPSHSESFGMVVAEALAHGLPVLTTTSVPWPSLTEADCGWRAPPTTSGLVDGLREASSCAPERLWAMGARGRRLVEAEYGWGKVAAQFVALYERVLAGRANDQ